MRKPAPADLDYPLKDGSQSICPRSKGFTHMITKLIIDKPVQGVLIFIAFQNPDTEENLVLRGETHKEGDRALYIIVEENSPAANEIIALRSKFQ